MINRIGPELNNKLNRISFMSTEKKEDSKKQNPVKPMFYDFSNNGLDATAAYNIGLMHSKDKNLKQDENPLKPIIDTDKANEINGEKIYNNDGTLRHIIIRNEDTIEYYIPDEDDNTIISEVKIIDKKTGKVVAQQFNSKEKDDNDNEYKSIVVKEFSTDNPNKYREANYENGEIVYTENESEQDGKVTNISYNYNSKTFSKIDYNSDDTEELRIFTEFDKNKQIMSFEESNYKQGYHLTINYYKGTPISYYCSQGTTFPSDIKLDKLNNLNLMPAGKEEKPKNIRKIEGEKTYYSNGAIESNTFDNQGQKVTAIFDDDGTLAKILTENKDIEFNNGQKITERLDNNMEKITRLYDDEDKRVTLKDNNVKSYKSVLYDKNNNVSSYEEGIITDDNDETANLTLWFDENGNLDDYIEDNN